MENKLNVENEKTKSLNITMLILQCVGIIAVVFGHADIGGANIPNFLNRAFPYYSWHMPFFIFISGYFFNRNLPAGKYIVKKLRSHLLPAFIVNAVSGVFSLCLKIFNLTTYGKEITLKSLFITPFTTGYQFYINVSLWFIFALFIIEIIACIMDRLAKNKADFVYLLVTLIISLFCCHRAFFDYDGTRGEFLNAGLRLGFLMFFFWLGVCYRRYFEKFLKPILNYKWSILIFAVQATILGFTKYTITYNTRNMNLSEITVPNGFWVAVVAPLTALLFFFGLAYSLSPYLEKSTSLQNFGRNTKYVVYYHQFLFVFFSIILAILWKLKIIPTVPGYSFSALQSNQYFISGNPAIACVIAIISIILPIVVCRRIEKQRWYVAALIYLGIALLIIAILYLAGRLLN